MYRGHRDPMTAIAVPQAWCDTFVGKTDNKTWVEIHIPPETALPNQDPMKWPALALPPEQVYFQDDVWNEFHINAGAIIVLTYKDIRPDGTRIVLDTEEASTEHIRARVLNLFLKHDSKYAPGGTGKRLSLDQLDNCFIRSGRTMRSCISQYLPDGHPFK